MKRRREGFSAGCLAFNSSRAAATSGRSCSAACRTFFERDLVAVVEPPDRAGGNSELLLTAQTVADLLKCQVGLLRHEIEQPLLVDLERRAAVAGAGSRRDAALPLPPIKPTHRRRGGKLEQTRDLPPAFSLLHHCNRTLAQVFRVPLRHGTPPLPLTKHSNLICTTVGIPRGSSDSHQVETALGASGLIVSAEALDRGEKSRRQTWSSGRVWGWRCVRR